MAVLSSCRVLALLIRVRHPLDAALQLVVEQWEAANDAAETELRGEFRRQAGNGKDLTLKVRLI